MRALSRSLLRYPLPLAVTALAAALSLALTPLGPRVPFAVFIAAVLVSAWWGGLRPALLTTVVSAAALSALWYFRVPPGEGREDYALRIGMFVLVGLLAGYLSEQCRRAVRAVDHVHDLFNGSGLGVIAADAEGRVTSLNALARTLTGWGDAEAVGVPVAQIFRPVDERTGEPLTLPLAEVAAGAAPHRLPEGTALLSSGGGVTPIEGTAQPLRDDAGGVTGVVLTFAGAAERARAREELRRRAERFRALAGHAPTPLLLLDAEGRCVFANPAAQAACDCSADECLGEGWSRHVVAADRDRVLSHWPAALVARQPFADEVRVQAPGGAARWFRLRASPMLSEGGDLLGQVATLEDVSERRQSEEQRREERRLADALLEAVPDAVVVKDAHGRGVRANAPARLLADGPGFGAVAERLAEAEENVWETGQPRSGEIGVGEGEGRATYATVHTPVRDEAGAVVGLIEIVRDVSGQRRAEQAARDHRRLGEALTAADAARRQAEETHRAALAELTERLRRGDAERHRLQEAAAEAARRAEESALAQNLADEALRQARADFERDLESALAGQQRAEDELRQARAEWERRAEHDEGLRQALETAQATAARHEEVIAGQHEERGRLREECRTLRARVEELGQALEEARQRAPRDEGEVIALREALGRGEEELSAARARLDEARAALASAREQTAGRDDDIRHLREELSRRDEAAQALAARYESETRRLGDELRRHQDGYTTACDEARRRDEAWRREVAELTAARENAEAALRAELARQREDAARLRERLAEVGEQAEARRREKEFLEGVIESSPEGIFAHDRDGRCLVWNAALERLLKRTKAEALGRTAFDLFPSANGGGPHPTLASAHATVRVPSGEVVGGMALVRTDAGASNGIGNGPHRISRAASSEVAARDDRDWLAFN